MMGTYWQKFGGRVRLDQIMQAANINILDLPFPNKYANGNGRNKLCWPSVLVRCTRRNCEFIHEKGRDLTEAFVEEACLKLEKGVKWVVDTQNALPNGPFGGASGGAGRGSRRGRGN